MRPATRCASADGTASSTPVQMPTLPSVESIVGPSARGYRVPFAAHGPRRLRVALFERTFGELGVAEADVIVQHASPASPCRTVSGHRSGCQMPPRRSALAQWMNAVSTSTTMATLACMPSIGQRVEHIGIDADRGPSVHPHRLVGAGHHEQQRDRAVGHDVAHRVEPVVARTCRGSRGGGRRARRRILPGHPSATRRPGRPPR